MAHTYTNILLHCVFSTKNRERIIAKEWRDRLWAFMGGIARDNRMKALAVGGDIDHTHLLLSVPPTVAASKAMQLIDL
ncbi:MAG TPA: transposase [Thermoanaerobaculia bacterium]|nr:transposase [Thermoanaerobaculia bacterium]